VHFVNICTLTPFPGILYATFHFPESPVNILSGEGRDAETLCPEYKLVAVDIERADWIGAHAASW
jgi:predicted molibdopterin-dependent oxidoreductase YjgC